MDDLILFFPAAGASSRMKGADKLMMPLQSVPLLRRQVLRGIKAEIPVVVTLPSLDHPRARSIDDLAVTILQVPDHHTGMAASFRAIGRTYPKAAVLVVLPDMPALTTEDFRLMVEKHREKPDHILRATAEDGTLGHPVLFPPWAAADFINCHGDSGARDILKNHKDKTLTLPLAGNHALVDLDTPQAWQDWRNRDH